MKFINIKHITRQCLDTMSSIGVLQIWLIVYLYAIIVFNRLFQTINIDPNIGVTVDNNLSRAVSDDRYYRNLYLFIKILITVFGWLRAILKKKIGNRILFKKQNRMGPKARNRLTTSLSTRASHVQRFYEISRLKRTRKQYNAFRHY